MTPDLTQVLDSAQNTMALLASFGFLLLGAWWVDGIFYKRNDPARKRGMIYRRMKLTNRVKNRSMLS